MNIGLLGGGQLGRMLLQEAANWDLRIAVLDPSADAPCANLTYEFVHGDFRDYDTVYSFGKNRDLITIEFEDVNIDALFKLEQEGVSVFPQPAILNIIKDKGAQKEFYRKNAIPTAPYALVENASEIASCGIPYPFFQKLRKGGYDGYGVKKIKGIESISEQFDAPSVIEQMANLVTELSVIVARNNHGEIRTFPVVNMAFNPESNMVQFLFSPAGIPKDIEQKAENIARDIIEGLQMVGILAVELFYTKEGEIWVNEIAPRPHNSGHHTIEANICSQYEQHLRAICNLPLANTNALMPAAMVNITGEKDHQGVPYYQGMEDVLIMEGAFVHLYGKQQTKPFRKMGHVTLLAPTIDEAKNKAKKVLQTLKVLSQ
ncbi:MAG: 5-(carboxyamino)imidazole ribonucleotide synthase [Flavobacteriales bacterium]|nr:5-(carboxyamino)imidazole ribonucleotide synthase [Flavobacteriales bacterium]